MNVGAKVWIHAMGSYYAGEVIQHGTKAEQPSGRPLRVLVRYTSGAGAIREKWHALDQVSGQYFDSVHNRLFPLVDGAQPQPAGARARVRS